MKKLLILTTIVVSLGFLVILVWAGSTTAAPPQLKGEYAFTGDGGCLTTTKGFDPLLTPKIVNGQEVWTSSHSVQGVRNFDGDGYGSVQVRVVSTSSLPHAAAYSSDISFQFTYSVDKDGTISTEMVPGTFKGKVLTGPRTGQTYWQTPFSLSGMASKDKKTLTLATESPEIETSYYSDMDVFYSICHRSRALIWLGE
jgi:hypothetical protein